MMPTHWICPVCHQVLQAAEGEYHCDQGHVFDRAKEGYVNLLLANQRHSANPGDDKQMLRSRREFLEQGYYQPLACQLAKTCVEEIGHRHAAAFALLDSGCGEGYYTGRVAAALKKAATQHKPWIGGIDISKDAVRMASRRYRDANFAVASSATLPVADSSLDCVARIFAPGSDEEVRRALKPDGLFIRVTPGPRHLYALRRLIYAQPREHEPAQRGIEGLQHILRLNVEYEMTVRGEGDVGRLLSMTPYYWQADQAKQAYIATLQELVTEVSFCVDCYRLRGANCNLHFDVPCRLNRSTIV